MGFLDIHKSFNRSDISSNDNSLSEQESIQEYEATNHNDSTPIQEVHSIPKKEISNYYILPSRFDDKQKSVIFLDNGLHLVLAPAGCGKTDILAERVYRALCKGVNVDDMICLTFTNRASRGMRARVRKLIGDNANDLFIGNTHRFCSQFLFQNNIINQSSAILDDDDILSIINSYSNYVIGNADHNLDAA